MIKGVNKSIIEVNTKDNEYFDKLIIFLKDNSINMNEEDLMRSVSLIIGHKPPDFMIRKLKLKMLTCGIIGATAALCIVGALLLFV